MGFCKELVYCCCRLLMFLLNCNSFLIMLTLLYAGLPTVHVRAERNFV